MIPSRDYAAETFLSITTQKRLKRVFLYIVALLTSLFTFVPLYVMLLLAIESPRTAIQDGQLDLIPRSISLENFHELFTTTNAMTYIVNSLIVTTGVVIVATTIAVIAGYTLTRFEFRGKSQISRAVLVSYMFSAIVLAIPIYMLYYHIGLLNHYLGLILGIAALVSPFNIWLMWQYFDSIPISLEERAWTEGASRWRAVWDVVVPVSRPGIMTAAIFSFSAGWNDYTFSRVVLSDQEMYTLPVGTALFLGPDTSWTEAMAISVIICIPPFLIALFFQKYLLQGINIGETT